jgi:para-nitrobenzyl esterase
MTIQSTPRMTSGNALLTIAFALTTLTAAGVPPASAAPVAKVDGGRLSGAQREGLTVWRGIPFAAAPVGELRWRPPQPVKPWKGVRDATQPGAACPQPSLAYKEPTSEDCLTLNVWAPAEAKGAPVLLWFHGGGFVQNSGNNPSFDGTRLAQRGIIVVTSNYRLGALGLFAHPALTREAARRKEPTGNYATMDQIAALRWVRDNIAAFGGDPKNVTISGSSAGGTSSLVLTASPAARGLFAKAIVHSSGGSNDVIGFAEAEKAGAGFAKMLGVEGDDLAALRAVPADRIVAARGIPGAASRALPQGSEAARRFGEVRAAGSAEDLPLKPFIDGQLVTDQLDTNYERGAVAPIRLVIGATNGESGGKGPVGDLIEARGSMAMSVPRADGVVKAGGEAFLFYFAYSPSGTPVRHGGAVPYAFGNLGQGSRSALAGGARGGGAPDPAMLAAAETVSATVMDYLTTFMKTGTPAAEGRAAWEAYRPAAPKALAIEGAQPRLVPVRVVPGSKEAVRRAMSDR